VAELTMKDFERIKQECFWDSSIDEEDFFQALKEGEHPKKRYLFEKILLNSTKVLLDLQLFDRKELKTLLEEYSPPEFNHDYAFRRKNIAEYYFFDKPLEIDELKWPA